MHKCMSSDYLKLLFKTPLNKYFTNSALNSHFKKPESFTLEGQMNGSKASIHSFCAFTLARVAHAAALEQAIQGHRDVAVLLRAQNSIGLSFSKLNEMSTNLAHHFAWKYFLSIKWTKQIWKLMKGHSHLRLTLELIQSRNLPLKIFNSSGIFKSKIYFPQEPNFVTLLRCFWCISVAPDVRISLSICLSVF